MNSTQCSVDTGVCTGPLSTLPHPRKGGEATRARILGAIAGYTESQGRPPTIREIMAATGLRSVGHVGYHLALLRDAGHLVDHYATARGAMLRDTGDRGCVGCAGLRARVAELEARLAALDGAT